MQPEQRLQQSVSSVGNTGIPAGRAVRNMEGATEKKDTLRELTEAELEKVSGDDSGHVDHNISNGTQSTNPNDGNGAFMRGP